MVFVIFPVIAALQGVQEVEVKIPGTCAFKAGVELLLCGSFIRALLPGTELGAERVGFPGIAVHQGKTGSLFGLAVVIDIGGIEVCAAGFQKSVHHLAGLGNIDAAVRILGQTHQTEPQSEWIATHDI